MGQQLARDVGREHVLAVLQPIWQTRAETSSRVRERVEQVISFERLRQGCALRISERLTSWINAFACSDSGGPSNEFHDRGGKRPITQDGFSTNGKDALAPSSRQTVEQWRGRQARGDVVAVRHAGDWVAGFQYRNDAERC
jgi:hypothetical protein